MDFFNRQDRIKTRSRLFFSAFFPALALAVVAIYFAVTFGILLVGSLIYQGDAGESGFGSFTAYHLKYTQPGGRPTEVDASLPADLYGRPPRVISATSFFRVGGVIVVIILFAAFCKCCAIRSGGGAYIARKLGGVEIKEPKNPAEKKLLHITEEMALASGLPRPRVFILPKENTINAVTAGLDHSDAVIAVTQGALDQLTRDELQGVIAHEFAHILNEDCVLNMIMAGWLYGLLVFSATGKGMCSVAAGVCRGVREADFDLRLIVGAIVFVYIPGAVLRAAGSLGHLTASIIEAAFSRSREHLADAFAVQFTRSPQGLAGALKKIGGTPRRANIRSGQALAMKSFFIASPNPRRNGGLLSAHPPLKSRILALDPQWDGKFSPINLGRTRLPESAAVKKVSADQSSTDTATPSNRPSLGPEAWLAAAVAALEAEARATDGPTEAYARLAGYGLSQAAEYRDSLPERLLEATKTPGGAEALVYAVFFDSRAEVRDRQTDLVVQRAGRAAQESAAELYSRLDRKMRLPLLELVNPVLRDMPEETRRRMAPVVEALAAADGRIDIFEIAGLIVLKKSLLPPTLFRKKEAVGPDAFSQDASAILTCLAHMGTRNHQAAEAAFTAACSRCPDLTGAPRPLAGREAVSSGDLMAALERLGRAPLKTRTELLRATVTCAVHDGIIVAGEYHLLGAVAAALGLPLPWPSIMED